MIFINQPYLIKKDYSRLNVGDLKEISKNFFYSLRNINNHNDYEKIKIEIPFKNYLKLMNDRSNALQTSTNQHFLSEKKKVKGLITYKNKKIPVKIRLKGDRADHWLSKKRLSLYVEIVGNYSLFGFKNFSITNHLSRQFPENVLIAKSLGRSNLLNYKFQTIKVDFNEQNWGLMLLQEEISPYYFESRKIKETPIARFTNEEDRRLLSKLTTYKIDQKEVYNHTKLQSIFEIDVKKKSKYLQNQNTKNIISFFKTFHLDNLKLNKINSKSLINHFNLDKFAALLSYSITFKDLHNTFFTNVRFYFNPYTNKVEPIPNDYMIDYFDTTNNEIFLKDLENFLRNYTNKIYINLFNNIYFQNKLFYYFKLIRSDLDKMNNDLLSICHNFVSCNSGINFDLIQKNLDFIINNKRQIIKVLNKVYQIKNEDIFKQVKFEKFKIKAQNNIALENKTLTYLKNFLYYRIFDDGNIEIKNLSLFDVIINKIVFFDDANQEIVCFKNEFDVIKINSHQKIEVNLELNNFCKSSSNLISTKFIYQVRNNLYEQTNFLETSKLKSIKNFDNIISENTTNVLDGKLLLTEPIILKKGQNLIINKNTEIKFSSDSYILVDGGELICNGKKNSPTILSSVKDEFWGGIYVRNSNNVKFENCSIENTKEFRSFTGYFITLTGGVNIYKSNVSLKNVTFKNSNAEDALNIINSNANLENIKIINTKSDGIDFDFSTGSINNMELDFIGGDGLDFSGSKFDIQNIKINRAIDKGLSIGEKSHIDARNILINDSEIGIAVKDASLLNLDNAEFKKNNFNIVGFNKKAYYKNGVIINIKNVKLSNEKIKVDKSSLIQFLD